jgi:hypothetical protein
VVKLVLGFLAGAIAHALYQRWAGWERGGRGVDLERVGYWRLPPDPPDARSVELMDAAELRRRIGA